MSSKHLEPLIRNECTFTPSAQSQRRILAINLTSLPYPIPLSRRRHVPLARTLKMGHSLSSYGSGIQDLEKVLAYVRTESRFRGPSDLQRWRCVSKVFCFFPCRLVTREWTPGRNFEDVEAGW